jgi:tetratricopeptide (TPR) repeat protein
MKKVFIFMIGMCLLIILSIGSYKKLNSSHYQSVLLYDFNNGTDLFTLEDSKFDDNFPTLTATALPIKFLKARYYLEIDSIEAAKKLLHKSIEENRYIGSPEALLANIFLAEEEIDSALYYSKKAFYSLSNNNRHRDTYFRALKEINDSISLDSAFSKIKNINNEDHWYNYILTRNDINKKPNQNLLNLFDEMRIAFPLADTLKMNSIKRFIELGSTRYTSALAYSELAKIEFEKNNYSDAVKFYEISISLDDKQYVFFENAAISYDNLKNYSKAGEYFNKVIYDFKISDGKSEFYKGLMLIKNNNLNNGCEYLEKSAVKNYVGGVSGLRAVNVYRQLCKS